MTDRHGVSIDPDSHGTRVASILAKTSCSHGYDMAGWCSSCHGAAEERVAEIEARIKLEKRIRLLEGALTDVTEWQHDTEIWRSNVNDVLNHITESETE